VKVERIGEKGNVYRLLVEKPSQEIGEYIILRWILEIEWSGMYWIDLAQAKDKRRALANTEINLWVS
jgi:hypothetical protein